MPTASIQTTLLYSADDALGALDKVMLRNDLPPGSRQHLAKVKVKLQAIKRVATRNRRTLMGLPDVGADPEVPGDQA
jgi:hypothetical protein